MDFLKAFGVGGLICVLGQILLDKTRISSSRILVIFVMAGCVLGGLGLYEPFAKFAGAGASVPLPGFGYLMAKGVIQEVNEKGLIGVLSGGLKAGAGGITAALLCGLAASFVFNPQAKK